MATNMKVQGILEINGRQITDTFNGLSKEARSLERDLKKLVPGTEEYIKKSEELKIVSARLQEVRTEINANKKAAQELAPTVNGTFSSMKEQVQDYFAQVLTGQVSFKQLGGGIKAFAAESWAAISSIPLIGWLAAVAAGIGVVVKNAMDYNKEIGPQLKLLGNLGLDKTLLPQMRALKESFGIEFNEIADMMDNLVDAGVVKDQAAALESLKIALAKAPNKGELISFLEANSESAKKLGFSLDELIKIKQHLEGTPMNPEKVFGAMDTYVSKVLSQSEKIIPTLEKSFGGDFTKNLYKGLTDGSLKYSESLNLIYKKGEDLKISDKERADIAKALFGKASASAYGYNEILKTVSESQKKLNADLDESTKLTLKIADANEQNAIAMDKAFNSKGVRSMMKQFELAWIFIKTGFYNIVAILRNDLQPVLATVGKYVGFLVDPFVKVYHAITQVSGGVNIFKVAWEALLVPLKAGFLMVGSFIDVLSYLREKIYAVVTGFGKWLGSFAPVNSALSSMGKYINYAKDVLSRLFNYIVNFPQAYHAMEAATKAFFRSLANTFSVSAEGLKDILSGIVHFDSNQVSKGFNSLKNALKTAALDASKTFQSNFAINMKVKHDQEAVDDTKEPTVNDSDFSGKPKKEKTHKPKKEKDPAAEALAASEKEIMESENRKLEIINKINAEKLKLQQESYEREIAEANAARSEEFRKLAEDGDKMLLHITELENKKLKSKNPAEIANLQKAIKAEREAIYHNDLLIQQTEETHQMKLKTIREKWEGIKFQKFVESEQRRINEDRRLAEDKINNISTMEEAELALSEMKNLKLTDQELAGIKTLEDAKKALRENADREMLKAQLKSLEVQKKQLEEALKGLTGEAAEKLKKDLDELNSKITQVKGAINGGTEADAKKVEEEQSAAKEKVDILGFSAKDWEESFKNLDTTSKKLKAIGMVFQALSNAGQMFAELQKSLGERDLKRFEQVQNGKKKALLKQLNEGFINQEEYNAKLREIEAQTANKKANIEYKQAKADKISRMFGIVGATAMAVATALTAGPIAGPILAGIIGALGAVQLGIVAAQPLPERPSFATGGFTGSGFGSPDETGYRPAGIVHQNEWVAPEWMTQNPRTANIINWLEAVRTGRTTPMAEGGFAEEKEVGKTTTVATNSTDPQLLSVLLQISEFLEYLKENDLSAYMVADLESAKLIRNKIKELTKIENSASQK